MTARHLWLTPIILGTWEADIKRIVVWSQPRQIVYETLSQKYSTQKWLEEWLKWQSACLSSVSPSVQTSILLQKTKKQKKKPHFVVMPRVSFSQARWLTSVSSNLKEFYTYHCSSWWFQEYYLNSQSFTERSLKISFYSWKKKGLTHFTCPRLYFLSKRKSLQ
jgi:hypothetical protein